MKTTPNKPATVSDAKILEAIPSTQSLCVLPATDLSSDELVTYHFGEARRVYDEVENEDQMSLVHEQICFALRKVSVTKARLVGDHLNRAKMIVKKSGEEWLPVLRKKFGKERNGQNFMKIARRWDECELELEKHPNHSINSLLQALRKKDHWPWPKPSEKSINRGQVFNQVKNLLYHVWPVWSSEDIQTLYYGLLTEGWDDELEAWFVEVMKKLRWKIHRQNNSSRLDAFRIKREHTSGLFHPSVWEGKKREFVTNVKEPVTKIDSACGPDKVHLRNTTPISQSRTNLP